jgi:hypothetical protein
MHSRGKKTKITPEKASRIIRKKPVHGREGGINHTKISQKKGMSVRWVGCG